MQIPKDIMDAIDDIIKNYDFSKKELQTIYMFVQTLSEYKPKEVKS